MPADWSIPNIYSVTDGSIMNALVIEPPKTTIGDKNMVVQMEVEIATDPVDNSHGTKPGSR